MRPVSALLLSLTISLLILSSSHSPGTENSVDEFWMGIYSDGKKVGYTHTFLESRGEELHISEETKLLMSILGKERLVGTKSNYRLENYEITSFIHSMTSGSSDLRIKGEKKGGTLEIETISVSGRTDVSFQTDKPTLPYPVIYRWLASLEPKDGESFEITVFDPTTVVSGAKKENLKANLKVEAREKLEIRSRMFETYRVMMEFMGSEFMAWITEDGEVVKETVPPALTLIRETREKAIDESLFSLDISRKSSVTPDVPLNNVRELKSLRLKIMGLNSAEGFELHDGYRQFQRKERVEIKVGNLTLIDSYSVPYSGKKYESFLKPGALIQSANIRIIETSKKILNGETNALKAANLINRWVYDNVEKEPTVSVPNALDVLKTKAGDCNEHAALFAALSRASGIPTKIALGIVFTGGEFYYHAWNEVFVGQWVAADPTFGQFPADASHVKFIEGDLGRTGELLKLVGKIDIEIIEAI